MRYGVRRLEIEFGHLGSDEAGVIEARQACRGGRGGGPGEECLKLESLRIERAPGGRKVRLRPASGTRPDAGPVERCPAHVAGGRYPEAH